MRSLHLNAGRILVLGIAMMVIIVSAEFSAEFQVDFAVPRSPPSQVGLSELSWIRDHLGFDNPSVIIVVRDPSSYLWALAYNGGLIYFGNLFYLLTNRTDYSMLNNNDPQVRSDYIGSIQRLWIYGVPKRIDSGKYLILLPSDLYNPDVLEMQALAAYDGGVFSVKQLTTNSLQNLFASWTLAQSTNDILGAARPYLAINPVANCTSYSSWLSTSSTTIVRVARNFTNVFPCSLHVTATATKDLAEYAFLKGTWNLTNESYLGFYFKGTANSTGNFFLTVLLGSAPDYTSYYYYNVIDETMWDGKVHSLVLQLSRFQSKDSPVLSSISSIQFGLYSNERGVFDYSLEDIVVAS